MGQSPPLSSQNTEEKERNVNMKKGSAIITFGLTAVAVSWYLFNEEPDEIELTEPAGTVRRRP